jgi:hypothetical protein
VLTCTLTEITCSGSQIFIMCVCYTDMHSVFMYGRDSNRQRCVDHSSTYVNSAWTANIPSGPRTRLSVECEQLTNGTRPMCVFVPVIFSWRLSIGFSLC